MRRFLKHSMETTYMQQDPADIARESYLAYVRKDRAAIEALIGEDFHFTSLWITAWIATPTSRVVGPTARRSPTFSSSMSLFMANRSSSFTKERAFAVDGSAIRRG